MTDRPSPPPPPPPRIIQMPPKPTRPKVSDEARTQGKPVDSTTKSDKPLRTSHASTDAVSLSPLHDESAMTERPSPPPPPPPRITQMPPKPRATD